MKNFFIFFVSARQHFDNYFLHVFRGFRTAVGAVQLPGEENSEIPRLQLHPVLIFHAIIKSYVVILQAVFGQAAAGGKRRIVNYFAAAGHQLHVDIFIMALGAAAAGRLGIISIDPGEQFSAVQLVFPVGNAGKSVAAAYFKAACRLSSRYGSMEAIFLILP